MPGSIIGELILRPILEIVVHTIGYYVGLFLIPILTLGRIKCDRIGTDLPGSKDPPNRLHYRQGKQLCLTGEGTGVFGTLIVLVVFFGWLLVRYH